MSAAWTAGNRDKRRLSDAAWRNANPEKAKLRDTKYRAANREVLAQRDAAYRLAHPEKARTSVRNWARRNADVLSATVALRRAAKLQATPAWANHFFIEEAYHLAKLRTDMFGFAWHVDHVVPLKSQLVCGLHTEQNLQVIPARDNIAKSNRHWPDMP